MGLNLWWVRNDGIGGHAWLSPHDLLSLREEMLAQGMAWEREEEPEGGAGSAGASGRRLGIPEDKLAPSEDDILTPREIAEALEAASWEPQTLSDRKLWQDWLEFLEGARRAGGIMIR